MADHYEGRIWPGQPDEDGGDIYLWAGAEEAFFGSVGGEDFPAEVTQANARRVAAAWNATLGLPVEALESGIVRRLIAAAPDLEEGTAYFLMLSVRLGAEMPGDVIAWAKKVLVDKLRSGPEVARAAIAKLSGKED